jgi:hypothetical protein
LVNLRLLIAGIKLEGHKAVQFHILRFVHHTHTAVAELFDDAVMRYGFADKRIGTGHAQHILEGDKIQVNEK